jgi:hypothetical protein
MYIVVTEYEGTLYPADEVQTDPIAAVLFKDETVKELKEMGVEDAKVRLASLEFLEEEV